MSYKVYQHLSGTRKKAPCWICGRDATTGEHSVKRSDLKSEFGPVTPNNPIYVNNDRIKNRRIGGLKSDRLKLPAGLCAFCNNERTQPHDQAWEQFSTSLRTRNPPISAGVVVRANRVFAYDTKQMMLNVHLYFVKLFGCHVVENAIPIDLTSLANSILHGKAHPNIYLKLVDTSSFGKSAGVSEIYQNAYDPNGEAFAVIWIYRVGKLGVVVLFCKGGGRPEVLREYYHPSFGHNRLLIYNFDENVRAFLTANPSIRHTTEHHGISITKTPSA
jgi:hypothetical protein